MTAVLASTREKEKTHWLIKWMLIIYVVVSPYDLTPPLRGILPQLSAEWVDLIQIPFIIVGVLLLIRERRPPRLPLWGAEFLIIAGSLLTLPLALNLPESTETLLKDLYMYLFFIMIVNLVRDRQLLVTLIRIWQVLAIIQAMLILTSSIVNFGKPAIRFEQQAVEMGLEVNSGAGIQEQHLVKRQVLRSQGLFAPGRQAGTLPNANLAGLYLSGATILLLGMPLFKRWWLHYASVALAVLGVILTGSNSTLGALLVAVVVYFLFKGALRERLLWLGIGALSFGLMMGVFILEPPDKLLHDLGELAPFLEQGVARVPESTESRLAMVLSGWEQFRERPIGLAPHGMRESTAERNVHNDYAAYLYERGFLGFLGIILLLGGAAMRAIYSGMNGDANHRRLMAMLLGVLFVTIVTELAHEYMREREVWLTMAMIILFSQFEFEGRMALQRRAKDARRVPEPSQLAPAPIA